MYDFYLGSREDIEKDPRRFLLAIKRMLPRWANSLPDSEYCALFDFIEEAEFPDGPVFVETGVGASTLVLVHHAMQSGGRAFSWDLSPSKGSFVRSVCAEALETYHEKRVADHWTFIAANSLSEFTGLGVLAELVDRIDLSMHDSDHTWNSIKGEVEAVMPLLRDGSIVCVDDANQDYVHTYEPLINMARKKMGLGPIAALANNRAEPHFKTVAQLLRRHFERLDDLSGQFRAYLDDDLYYAWYEAERAGMSELGMERMNEQKNRFAAWRLGGRRTPPAE